MSLFYPEFTFLKFSLFIPGSDREDAKLRKSVSAGYSTELLNIVVHYSENVEFLKNHGMELLTLGEQGKFVISLCLT